MTNFATAFHAVCVHEEDTTKIRCSLSFNNNAEMYNRTLYAAEQAGLKIVGRDISIGFTFDLTASDEREARKTLKQLNLNITEKQASLRMPNGYWDVCCSPVEAIQNAYRNILTPA